MADELDNLLHQGKTDKKSDLDVLKELFTNKEIETKTDLSVGQIILFNQKRTIADLLQWTSLRECLDDFMVLMISKDRKGRGEFVDGFKGEREREIQANKGFFSGFGQRMGFK